MEPAHLAGLIRRMPGDAAEATPTTSRRSPGSAQRDPGTGHPPGHHQRVARRSVPDAGARRRHDRPPPRARRRGGGVVQPQLEPLRQPLGPARDARVQDLVAAAGHRLQRAARPHGQRCRDRRVLGPRRRQRDQPAGPRPGDRGQRDAGHPGARRPRPGRPRPARSGAGQHGVQDRPPPGRARLGARRSRRWSGTERVWEPTYRIGAGTARAAAIAAGGTRASGRAVRSSTRTRSSAADRARRDA